jgi:hypothetical protein
MPCASKVGDASLFYGLPAVSGSLLIWPSQQAAKDLGVLSESHTKPSLYPVTQDEALTLSRSLAVFTLYLVFVLVAHEYALRGDSWGAWVAPQPRLRTYGTVRGMGPVKSQLTEVSG